MIITQDKKYLKSIIIIVALLFGTTWAYAKLDAAPKPRDFESPHTQPLLSAEVANRITLRNAQLTPGEKVRRAEVLLKERAYDGYCIATVSRKLMDDVVINHFTSMGFKVSSQESLGFYVFKWGACAE